MQIQRVHDEHIQFNSVGRPHVAPSNVRVEPQESLKNRSSEATSLRPTADSQEINSLINQLHLVPDPDVAVVQLAQARYRSGELLTRGTAKFVATSILRDFSL